MKNDKFYIDDRPPEIMTEKEYDRWLTDNGGKKYTAEEKAKALEEFYKEFPNERPNELHA